MATDAQCITHSWTVSGSHATRAVSCAWLVESPLFGAVCTCTRSQQTAGRCRGSTRGDSRQPLSRLISTAATSSQTVNQTTADTPTQPFSPAGMTGWRRHRLVSQAIHGCVGWTVDNVRWTSRLRWSSFTCDPRRPYTKQGPPTIPGALTVTAVMGEAERG